MSGKNLFEDIPPNFREELFETLLQSSGFHMERIVSYGHRSPEGFWYDQDENEWVILLTGEAVLSLEKNNETVRLKPGDYLLIEKHVRHRVEWTAPDRQTVWLAVYYK